MTGSGGATWGAVVGRNVEVTTTGDIVCGCGTIVIGKVGMVVDVVVVGEGGGGGVLRYVTNNFSNS